MVATVPIDLFLNFLIGATVAYAARADLRERAVPVWSNRYVIGALLFELLIFLPLGIYLYVAHTDWSWMYLFDGSRLSPLIGILAMMGYVLMMLAGYGAVHRALQRRANRLAIGLMAAAAAGVLVIGIALHGRLMAYGSYAAFHAGKTIPLWKSQLGFVLAGTGAAFIAGWAYLLRHFDLDGQRLASQGDLVNGARTSP